MDGAVGVLNMGNLGVCTEERPSFFYEKFVPYPRNANREGEVV